MKRWGSRLALVALPAFVACGDLREARPGADAGPDASAAPTDGGTSGGLDSRDASAHRDGGRVTCPAPCEPEQISTMGNLGPVVVDSFNVYFGSADGGVWKVTKSVDHKLTKLGDGKATRLVLAADRVWWGDGDHLVACAIGGCGGIPEGRLLDQTGIDELMTDGAKIVWHAHVGASDVIRACPAKTCGSATTEDVASILAPRAGMGLGANKVFWVDLQSKLYFCPLDSTPCLAPTEVAAGSNDASVFGDTVFWVHGQDIESCNAAGCVGPKKIGTSPSPHLLVADDSDLYWRELVDEKVLRCPVGGCAGDPEEIATGVDGIYYGGLALDAEYVYWTSRAGLFRRRK